MIRIITIALAAAVAPCLASIPTAHLFWAPGVQIPLVMLGTGGGTGGYDTTAWLQLGTATGSLIGYDSASTYCYATYAPYCSHVSIANSVISAKANSSNIFYLSKVEPEDFGPHDFMAGFGRIIDRGLLQDLSISRLDMVMAHQAGRAQKDNNVHPPCFNASLANTSGTYATCRVQMMQTFLILRKANVVRSIGVSNWQIRDLQQVFDATGEYPAALEIEVHPYFHEDALIAFCKANNITVINYAPLATARPALLAEPAVVAAAAAHGVTPAQVVLRWGLQFTGGVVIPRSANAAHMADNINIFGFTLSAAEMAAMSGYPQKKVRMQ